MESTRAGAAYPLAWALGAWAATAAFSTGLIPLQTVIPIAGVTMIVGVGVITPLVGVIAAVVLLATPVLFVRQLCVRVFEPLPPAPSLRTAPDRLVGGCPRSGEPVQSSRPSCDAGTWDRPPRARVVVSYDCQLGTDHVAPPGLSPALARPVSLFP